MFLGMVPYAYNGLQWVGYDDQQSLHGKLAWIENEGYLGWMVWNLDLDDFNGSQCSQGEYPLLKTLNGNAPWSGDNYLVASTGHIMIMEK